MRIHGAARADALALELHDARHDQEERLARTEGVARSGGGAQQGDKEGMGTEGGACWV